MFKIKKTFIKLVWEEFKISEDIILIKNEFNSNILDIAKLYDLLIRKTVNKVFG